MIRIAVVAIVAAVSVVANAQWSSPPRYDGAGYSVLAISLLQGRGYREIDHPDAPRHVHFPPGYPIALAGLWSVTGISYPAAHAFSFLCTLLAVILFALWVRTMEASGVAMLMAAALAVNWRWGRDGSAIQSEPLFLLLSQIAILVSSRVVVRGGMARALGLGVLLGLLVLTRHVGVTLGLALVIDHVLRGRRREAMLAVVVASLIVAPWAIWLGVVGGNTQVSLVPGRGIASVIAGNTWFYVQRLPDAILGPVVEVFTIFRPGYAAVATACAALACLPIVTGWVRLARDPKRRVLGLVPLCTMPLLLVWPFTEAGRFLIPLVPFLIAGAVEGVAMIVRKPGARLGAAILLLVVSLPYPMYAIASRRAEASRSSQASFDAACAWIARQDEPKGPVLTRHPGEVFLLTGRTAIAAPDAASPEEIAKRIARDHVAFLLIDDDRFANAPASPLGRYTQAFSDEVREVYVTTTRPEVRVFEVR